jgi:hypothetical protein
VPHDVAQLEAQDALEQIAGAIESIAPGVENAAEAAAK